MLDGISCHGVEGKSTLSYGKKRPAGVTQEALSCLRLVIKAPRPGREKPNET